MPMQYTAIFTAVKNDNFQLIFFFLLIFAQNIECGSTHNLCFRAKIMNTPVNPSI